MTPSLWSAPVLACIVTLLLMTPTAAQPGDASAEATWLKPGRDVQWQWQLAGYGDDDPAVSIVPKAQNVTLYDIDPDNGPDVVTKLRDAVPGAHIICYISVGTWEPYRKEADAERGIKESDWDGLKGNSYGGAFDDERWLDIRSPRVRTIMMKRFTFAQKAGCDGVEPDNVGAYQVDTGFPLTEADSLSYSRWIATAVHSLGMSVGLKNSLPLLEQLEPLYDWFLNEQCNAFDECDVYDAVPKSKPVLGTEYCDASAADNGVTQEPGCYCPAMIEKGFQWLIKTTDLDASRVTCQQYCAKYSCPGRAEGGSCEAPRKGAVCTTAFAASNEAVEDSAAPTPTPTAPTSSTSTTAPTATPAPTSGAPASSAITWAAAIAALILLTAAFHQGR